MVKNCSARMLAAMGLVAGLVLTGSTRQRLLAEDPAPKEPPQAIDDIVRVKLGDLKGSLAIGPENAPVTVVAIIDYECPYCARAHGVLDQLRDKYADQVRLVFKHNPLAFHPQAELAAQAVLVAQEFGKFPELHKRLLENQKALDLPNLIEHAKAVGIDGADFETALTSGSFEPVVEADAAFATRIGVSSTPFFLINGRALKGARPFEAFAAIIDDELAGPTRPTRWVDRVELPRRREEKKDPAAASPAPPGSIDEAVLRHLIEIRKELSALRSEVDSLRAAVAATARSASESKRVRREVPVLPEIKLGDGPSLGEKSAKLAILECFDYQCPFSRKFARHVFPALRLSHIETGKVLYLSRDFPLRSPEESRLAALGASCAGKQSRFWEMRAVLLAQEGKLDRALLEQLAQTQKIELAAFRACMADSTTAEEIESSRSAASVEPLQIRLTPTFFVGKLQDGRLVDAHKLAGVQTYEALTELIDALLSE